MHTCTNNVVLSLSRVYYHVFIVVSPYPIAVLLTAYCIICTFCTPAIPPRLCPHSRIMLFCRP
jgi:hypothetical protein